jgi:type III secretion protein O
MPYILEKILTVRDHRETKSLNHVVHCKEDVRRSVAIQRQKEQELDDYHQWRQLEEERRFDHLKQQPANVHDLLYYKDTIDTLRQDQAARARRVDEAAKQVVSAENTLQQARRHYAQACRQKMKIAEHKKIWMEDDRQRTERQNENELEEIAQASPNKAGIH